MTTRYIWAAVLTAVLIVYGSLSPFDFYAGAAANPVAYLLAHWRTPSQSGIGFIANLALYLPFGLFVALALGPGRARWARLVVALVLGTSLSVAVELTQVYDWGRRSTLTDTYLNALGALAGAWAATALPAAWQRPIGDLRQPMVLLLLAAFAVVELYPFVPTMNTGWYYDALARLWQAPAIAPGRFAAALEHWWLAGALFLAVFGARGGYRAWLAAAAIVFAGQIVILNIWLSASEWAAVLLTAPVLWLVTRLAPRAQHFGLAAIGLSAGLAAAGLVAHPAPSLWPFSAELTRAPIDAARRLVAVFYAVGGPVWLLARASGRPLVSAGIVALALAFCLVFAEPYRYGTVSTTGVLIALACGGLLAVFQAASSLGGGAKRNNTI